MDSDACINPYSSIEQPLRHLLSEEQILARTRNCADYFENHVNVVANLGRTTFEEEELPLAFGIMLHEQVESLKQV